MRIDNQRQIHTDDSDFDGETINASGLKNCGHVVLRINNEDLKIKLYMNGNNTQKLIKILADAIVQLEG